MTERAVAKVRETRLAVFGGVYSNYLALEAALRDVRRRVSHAGAPVVNEGPTRGRRLHVIPVLGRRSGGRSRHICFLLFHERDRPSWADY